MFDDWLDILARGHLEVNLPSLTLTIGTSSDVFRGTGRVTWQEGGAVRVEGVTDGFSLLARRFGQSLATPGHLISHDLFLTVAGQTQDGREVTTTSVPLDGYGLYDGSDSVLWDFTVPSLRLVRSSTRPAHPPVVRALLRPGLPAWPRASTIEDQNERFGGRRTQLDWLETTLAGGVLALRRRGDEFAELLFIAGDGSPPVNPCQLLAAVARACSLLVGRRVFVIGHEEG